MKRLPLLLALAILAACAEPTTAPTAIDGPPLASARVEKIDICHYDEDFDRFSPLKIAGAAEPDHRAHGDGTPGEPILVEGYEGAVFGGDCQPAVLPPPPPPSPCEPNSIGMAFTLIPAGTFQMGQEGVATPVHDVTITRDFCLGTYELTQGQWRAVMGGPPEGFAFDSCSSETIDDVCPAEQVSWNDVQAFVTALNAAEGTNAYRLPTEAEWEYAARAGTTTEWSWGSNEGDAGTYAWFSGNAGATTHPVGQKAANPWGLHDMHGNVWEWVQDWSGDYPAFPQVDPTGPGAGSYRVFRGGSWYEPASSLRSAYRAATSPGARSDKIGVRIVKALGS